MGRKSISLSLRPPEKNERGERKVSWHPADGPRSPLLMERRSSLHALTFLNSTINLMTGMSSASEISAPESEIREKEPLIYLKLNIGGTPFRLGEKTILNRCDFGLLHRFVTFDHQKRLQLCDDFDEATGEYFFERSGALFQPIHLYYLNGMRVYVPMYLRDHFIEELSFWGLAKHFYPNKLNARQRREACKLSLDEKFRLVRFGKTRKRVWHLLETPESSRAARLFAFVSIAAVLLSNMALVMSSMEEFQIEVVTDNATVATMEPHPFFDYIEYLCITLFTAEFAGKLLVTPERGAFFANYMNIIDFIAIAPFFFELTINNLGFDSSHLQRMQGPFLMMRILRVMRVIRLFKLGRHSTGLRLFVRVIWSTMLQLGVVMAVVGIGVMFFSTLMYYLEKDIPNSSFRSIPVTFWWSIVTMTTVGYGDMVPESTGGKLIGTCAIAMGVLVLSMPITIFVDRFINVQEEEQIERNR